MTSNTPTVVVYDGDCRFCRRQIERIKQLDPSERFEYLAWQSEPFRERFGSLANEDLNKGLRVITPDGRVLVGADAVYHITRSLSGWRWVAWLYRVPGLRSLGRWGYAWVAARRYRLGGCDNGTCNVE